MRDYMYIPPEVIEDIHRHLHDAVGETVTEMPSAWEDEDVVTGHLGALMTTRSRSVEVSDGEIKGAWRWSLHYRKFRGRGGGATERRLGADGIFEISLEGQWGARTKSILFQSKMAGSGGSDLLEQCARLSTWREAAFVMVYDIEDFRAVTIDAALESKGAVERAPSMPLADFLAKEFVACKVGDHDLHYSAVSRELRWLSVSDEIVAVKFNIPQRFRLKIIPPSPRVSTRRIDRQIQPDQIHRHRMKADEEDLLKVQYESAPLTAKQTIRALARIYHTDSFVNLAFDARELLKSRLQEFNSANTERKARDNPPPHRRSAEPKDVSPSDAPHGGSSHIGRRDY